MDLVTSLAGATPRFLTGFRHALRAGHRCPLHHHAALEVIFHPSGRGEAGLGDGSRLPITAGCAVIHAPRAIHDQRLDAAGEDWCVQLVWPDWPPVFAGRTWLVPAVEDPLLRLELDRLSHNAPSGPATDHRAMALVLDLLAASRAEVEVAAAGTSAVLADQAAALIRARYAELDGIAALARELGVGPDHLRHSFTARHGTSPVAYLTARRIERARDLLRYSLLPIAEIAGQCGYASARYFSSAFHRAVGCPPSAYRSRRGPEIDVLR